jgi:hypothetical protein
MDREALWRQVVEVKYGSLWGGWMGRKMHQPPQRLPYFTSTTCLSIDEVYHKASFSSLNQDKTRACQYH